VLAYNLIHNVLRSQELCANTDKDMSKLKLLFGTWNNNIQKDPTYPLTLRWLLKHKYTDANLRFQDLKGQDLQVVSRLREACRDLGFIPYLANITRERSGWCEHDPEDSDEYKSITHDNPDKFHEVTEYDSSSVDIDKVVDLSANEISGEPVFEEKNFIQADPFNGLTPDEEYYKGYQGK
jgi:hypothetical protein